MHIRDPIAALPAARALQHPDFIWKHSRRYKSHVVYNNNVTDQYIETCAHDVGSTKYNVDIFSFFFITRFVWGEEGKVKNLPFRWQEATFLKKFATAFPSTEIMAEVTESW